MTEDKGGVKMKEKFIESQVFNEVEFFSPSKFVYVIKNIYYMNLKKLIIKFQLSKKKKGSL